MHLRPPRKRCSKDLRQGIVPLAIRQDKEGPSIHSHEDAGVFFVLGFALNHPALDRNNAVSRVNYASVVGAIRWHQEGRAIREIIATLVSGVNADGSPFTLPVSSAVVVASDILDGRQAFTATTAATTLITVPAGRTWSGRIGASVSCTNSAAVGVLAHASAKFSTAGGGVTPAAGIYFGVDALAGANVAAGLSGTQGSNFGSAPLVVVAPVGNAVTIQVASTNVGTTSNVDAFASGQLL